MGARNRGGRGLSYTGPPGYIGWWNSFLGINSGAPYTFKDTGSVFYIYCVLKNHFKNYGGIFRHRGILCSAKDLPVSKTIHTRRTTNHGHCVTFTVKYYED
jgi:hypothetical protein